MDENNFEDECSDGFTSENNESSSQKSDALAIVEEDTTIGRNHMIERKAKRLKVELDQIPLENGDNNNILDRELEAIGANVACKLKRMNMDQRYHAELLINKVLITGLKNNLTDGTDLTEVYKT